MLYPTEQPPAPRADDERRILRERARVLALEPVAAEAPRDVIRVAEFELAGERYAFELAHVRQTLALKEITPVPCTPDFIAGIVNLRGEIHTVIDLRRFLHLPARGITQLNKVIVIESQDLRAGVIADAVFGVRAIPRDSLQPALPTLSPIQAGYLVGITADRLVVLDAGKILSDPRLLVIEEVEA